jgi:ATP-dependent Lon protease
MIEKFLGPPQFFLTLAERKDEVGVATGLAWTENGGEIMFVEVAILEGKGGMQITGQVGDVMQESAQAGLSYLKSRASLLGIDPDVFDRLDIHVHLPEGGIPKDGPSAGITMTSAVISAFTGRPIFKDVAMTGEITLRGRVLPIGGVREKVLAAHRAGIKTVILPERNLKDLVDVPKQVQRDLKLIPVNHMDQVLEIALSKQVVSEPPKPRKSAKEDQQEDAD